MDTSAIYFEDFKIGDSHTTYSRTMTETDIVLHADLGDVFPTIWMWSSPKSPSLASGSPTAP